MPIEAASKALAVAVVLSVSGCVSDGSTDALGRPNNWGEANRQTMAAQIVNPMPEYDYAIPESSAEHAAQAVDRYRHDKVKKPERVKTSAIGATGGGQGSSGGQ